MERPGLNLIAPCFIVGNATTAVAFYRDKLGFEVMYQHPDEDPFFAIVIRGGAMIMLKAVPPGIDPIPNGTRHPWAPSDAYVSVPDPDAMAAEFAARGVVFSVPL